MRRNKSSGNIYFDINYNKEIEKKDIEKSRNKSNDSSFNLNETSSNKLNSSILSENDSYENTNSKNDIAILKQENSKDSNNFKTNRIKKFEPIDSTNENEKNQNIVNVSRKLSLFGTNFPQKKDSTFSKFSKYSNEKKFSKSNIKNIESQSDDSSFDLEDNINKEQNNIDNQWIQMKKVKWRKMKMGILL